MNSVTKVVIAEDERGKILKGEIEKQFNTNADLLETVENFNSIALSGYPDSSVFILDLKFKKEGYDGIQLIKKVRDEKPYACIIVYSSYLDPQIISRCSEAGANHFVKKKQLKNKFKEGFNDIVNFITNYYSFIVNMSKEYEKINTLDLNIFDCKVISIDNNDVKLRIKDQFGECFERTFKKSRVDCEEYLKVTQCYQMVDTLISCGRSSLVFNRISTDPFKIDDDELIAKFDNMAKLLNANL